MFRKEIPKDYIWPNSGKRNQRPSCSPCKPGTPSPPLPPCSPVARPACLPPPSVFLMAQLGCVPRHRHRREICLCTRSGVERASQLRQARSQCAPELQLRLLAVSSCAVKRLPVCDRPPNPAGGPRPPFIGCQP